MADATMEGLSDALLAQLAARARPDGSALARPGESESSVEATAWYALALRLAGSAPGATVAAHAAGEALARLQAKDGRVSVSPLNPGAYSPTSIAVLAWHDRPGLATARPARRAQAASSAISAPLPAARLPSGKSIWMRTL